MNDISQGHDRGPLKVEGMARTCVHFSDEDSEAHIGAVTSQEHTASEGQNADLQFQTQRSFY